jgi:hypothetical protein
VFSLIELLIHLKPTWQCLIASGRGMYGVGCAALSLSGPRPGPGRAAAHRDCHSDEAPSKLISGTSPFTITPAGPGVHCGQCGGGGNLIAPSAVRPPGPGPGPGPAAGAHPFRAVTRAVLDGARTRIATYLVPGSGPPAPVHDCLRSLTMHFSPSES